MRVACVVGQTAGDHDLTHAVRNAISTLDIGLVLHIPQRMRPCAARRRRTDAGWSGAATPRSATNRSRSSRRSRFARRCRRRGSPSGAMRPRAAKNIAQPCRIRGQVLAGCKRLLFLVMRVHAYSQIGVFPFEQRRYDRFNADLSALTMRGAHPINIFSFSLGRPLNWGIGA